MTPFEQAIHDAFEPIYQKECTTIEGYLSELPIGSYVRTKNGLFEVSVYHAGGLFSFNAPKFADAYSQAMEWVRDNEQGKVKQ